MAASLINCIMAVPHSLARKLRDTLGQDSGEDLVTWLEEERAERAQLDGRMVAIQQQLAGLRELMAKNHAELLKWSFVFWVGAVTAIAALAGVFK